MPWEDVKTIRAPQLGNRPFKALTVPWSAPRSEGSAAHPGRWGVGSGGQGDPGLTFLSPELGIQLSFLTRMLKDHGKEPKLEGENSFRGFDTKQGL